MREGTSSMKCYDRFSCTKPIAKDQVLAAAKKK